MDRKARIEYLKSIDKYISDERLRSELEVNKESIRIGDIIVFQTAIYSDSYEVAYVDEHEFDAFHCETGENITRQFKELQKGWCFAYSTRILKKGILEYSEELDNWIEKQES